MKQVQVAQNQQQQKLVKNNHQQEQQKKETGKRKLDTKEEETLPQKQTTKKPKFEEATQPKGTKEKPKDAQISKVPTETEKAILAEEERRREERDKRSLFMKSEMFAKMKPSEIKALHPDVISVRPMHNVWRFYRYIS